MSEDRMNEGQYSTTDIWTDFKFMFRKKYNCQNYLHLCNRFIIESNIIPFFITIIQYFKNIVPIYILKTKIEFI